MTAAALPPLALYVHVPWCVRKCPYCDFNSHAHGGPIPEARWVARVLEDLALAAADAAGRPVESVFFGGGTPSLLSPAAVGAVLEGIAARLPFADEAEITLEANPGTAEAERFAGYRAAGVNRLSLGIQSFSDRALAALGRIHDAGEARRAVALARGAGFERLNLDLMHGLPGQSVAEGLADLEAALALEPEHLSWYQLTIEPNTVFHARPPTLPVEEVLGDLEHAGFERLAAAGLERYEVSAWSRPGDACRHNLGYWTFGDYLGVGPGAHGKVSRPGAGGLEVVRTRRTRTPEDWFGRGEPPRVLREPVPATALPGEFLLNALRLVEGVPEELLEARTGVSLERIRQTLEGLRRDGLLRTDRLATTPLGLRFLDRVTGAFLV